VKILKTQFFNVAVLNNEHKLGYKVGELVKFRFAFTDLQNDSWDVGVVFSVKKCDTKLEEFFDEELTIQWSRL
jgi:hypothetical protein